MRLVLVGGVNLNTLALVSSENWEPVPWAAGALPLRSATGRHGLQYPGRFCEIHRQDVGVAPLYAASDAVSVPWVPWPLMVPTQNGDTRSHGLVIRSKVSLIYQASDGQDLTALDGVTNSEQ